MARSRLAQLEISLSGNISRLTAALDRAERQTRSRSQAMARSLGRVTRALALVGAGVGLTRLGSNALDAADKIDKLTKRTGASAEFLSAMRFAVSQTGVSFEQFDKGLSKTQKSIGDALNGLQTQKRAFEQLGIEVRAFSELKPEQQFEILAEQLSKIENPAIRTQIAFDIMGRSGRELLSLMEGGAQGLRDYRAEAERLGVVLTDKQAKAAADANDAMDRFSKTIGGLIEQITLEAAPVITFLAEKLLALTKALKEAGKVFDDGLLSLGLRKTRTQSEAIQQEIEKLDARRRNLEGQIKQQREGGILFSLFGETKDIEKLQGELDRTESHIDTLRGALKAIAAQQKKTNDTANDYIDELGGVNERLTEQKKRIEAVKNAAQKNIDAYQRARDEWEASRAENDALNDSLKETIADLSKTERQLFIDNKLRELNADATKAQVEQRRKLAGLLFDSQKAAERSQQAQLKLWRSMQEIGLETIRGLRNAWVSLFEDVFSGRALNSIKDFFESIKTLAIRIAAEIAAAWAFRRLFGGLLGGASGGGLAALFGGSIGSTAGSGVISAGTSAAGAGLGALLFGGGAATVTSGAGGGPGVLIGAATSSGAGGGAAAGGVAAIAQNMQAWAAANPITAAILAGFAADQIFFGGKLTDFVLGGGALGKVLGGFGGRSSKQIFKDELSAFTGGDPNAFSFLAGNGTKVFGTSESGGIFADPGGELARQFEELGLKTKTFFIKGFGEVSNIFAEGADFGAERVFKLINAVIAGRMDEARAIISQALGGGFADTEPAAAQALGRVELAVAGTTERVRTLFSESATAVGASFEIIAQRSGQTRVVIEGDVEAFTRRLVQQMGLSTEFAQRALAELAETGTINFAALQAQAAVLAGEIAGISGAAGSAAGAVAGLASSINNLPSVAPLVTTPHLGNFAGGGTVRVPGTGQQDQVFTVGLTPGELVTVSDQAAQATQSSMLAEIRALRADLRRAALLSGGFARV